METNKEKIWIPLHDRERLSIPHLLAISANQLAANLIWAPNALLVNPMCTLFGINNIYATFIILIGAITGLIVPPISAALSDRCTLKWGRRRIFLVVGEILAFVGLMFLAFCDRIGNTNAVHITFLVLGNIIVGVGGNIYNGPGRSMCTDLAPESQQITISNFCQVHNGVAGVLSNLIGALKLYNYVGMKNAQFVLLVSCIVGFIALVTSIVVSHEEPLLVAPSKGKGMIAVIFEAVKLYDFELWMLALSFLFFTLGQNQYGTQIGNFMGMVIFHGDPNAPEGSVELQAYDNGLSHAQLLALIQTITQVCFSFLSTPITNLIGLKWTWFFGMACGTIAQGLFFLTMNKWYYVICAVLWGIDQCIGNSVPYSVISLYAPKDNMAGMLTVCVCVGNISAFIANFAFTMGLGSVYWFKSNPGRLIAVNLVFTGLAGIVGLFAITKVFNKKATMDDNSKSMTASLLSEENNLKLM